MVKAIFAKIRNIILLFVMFINVTGTSVEKQEIKKENDFVKDIAIELIGLDNTVVEFIDFIFN